MPLLTCEIARQMCHKDEEVLEYAWSNMAGRKSNGPGHEGT